MASALEDPAIAPGIYPDMTEAAYRAAPGLNISLLKHMDPTPAHCRQEQTAPEETTPARELGQALHAALLEPNEFPARFFRAPGVDRRSNAGKAAWAEALAANPGKTPMKPDDFFYIERMVEVLWADAAVAALLGGGGGRNELSAFWDMGVAGELVRGKGRLDRLTSVGRRSTLVDVKTTAHEASPNRFAREIQLYAYHSQAAYYLDGLDALAPAERSWVWLVVEKEPPFAHALYEPVPSVLEIGRSLYTGWLSRYVACAQANAWPGYPSGVHPIDLPAWAYRSLEEF